MGGRKQGSKDTKPRKRSKKTDFKKKVDAETRAMKKAEQEAAECARNLASFRASLHGVSRSTTESIPTIPEPLFAEAEQDPLSDAVEIKGIPHWTEQLNPGEITAQLDAQNDDDEDDTDDEKNLTSLLIVS